MAPVDDRKKKKVDRKKDFTKDVLKGRYGKPTAETMASGMKSLAKRSKPRRPRRGVKAGGRRYGTSR
jgi:hypothetical protein